jgi:hypothetical protein
MLKIAAENANALAGVRCEKVAQEMGPDGAPLPYSLPFKLVFPMLHGMSGPKPRLMLSGTRVPWPVKPTFARTSAHVGRVGTFDIACEVLDKGAQDVLGRMETEVRTAITDACATFTPGVDYDLRYTRVVQLSQIPGKFPPTVTFRIGGWQRSFENGAWVSAGGPSTAGGVYPSKFTHIYRVTDRVQEKVTDTYVSPSGAVEWLTPAAINKGEEVMMVWSDDSPKLIGGTDGATGKRKVNVVIDVAEIYMFGEMPAPKSSGGAGDSGSAAAQAPAKPSWGTKVDA